MTNLTVNDLCRNNLHSEAVRRLSFYAGLNTDPVDPQRVLAAFNAKRRELTAKANLYVVFVVEGRRYSYRNPEVKP